MCRPVTCKKCQKTTWAGCGQHVAAVKAQVPAGQWCTCRNEAGSKAKASSPAPVSAKNRFFSWFSRG